MISSSTLRGDGRGDSDTIPLVTPSLQPEDEEESEDDRSASLPCERGHPPAKPEPELFLHNMETNRRR